MCKGYLKSNRWNNECANGALLATAAEIWETKFLMARRELIVKWAGRRSVRACSENSRFLWTALSKNSEA